MSEPLLKDADDARNDSNYVVPGLERGLRILAEFSPREPVLGAPELSKRLGIPRTTVFRLLQTLESLGFLERADKDRNYRLGVAVLRLGFEYLSSLELTDLGLPVIESLRDATGFTAHIVIRDGRDVVFVAKAQNAGNAFGSVRVNVGTRLPAHATTHGHVLMGDRSRAPVGACVAARARRRRAAPAARRRARGTSTPRSAPGRTARGRSGSAGRSAARGGTGAGLRLASRRSRRRNPSARCRAAGRAPRRRR